MIDESILQRLRLREEQIFLALTIIIAIIAGLSAVLFTLAIQGTKHLLFGVSPSAVHLILAPTIVSLVTGFLLAKFFPDVGGGIGLGQFGGPERARLPQIDGDENAPLPQN